MEPIKNNATVKTTASSYDLDSQESSIKTAPVQDYGFVSNQPIYTPTSVNFEFSPFSLISDYSECDSIVISNGVIPNSISSTQDNRTLQAGAFCHNDNAMPTSYYCSENNESALKFLLTNKCEQKTGTNTLSKNQYTMSPIQQLSTPFKACCNSSSHDLFKNHDKHVPKYDVPTCKINSQIPLNSNNSLQNLKEPHKSQDNHSSGRPDPETSKINSTIFDENQNMAENINNEKPDKHCVLSPDHANAKCLDFFSPSSSSFPLNEHYNLRRHNLGGCVADQTKCCSSCNLKLQPLYSKETEPCIPPLTNCLTHVHKSFNTSVPDYILAVLHGQDQKIKELQNQLFVFQQQKNMSEHRLSEVIDRLQDQVSVLVRRTDEFESLNLSKNSDKFLSEPNSFPVDNVHSNCKENFTPNKKESEGDNIVVCHEKTEVKKTSSSTMTSLTFEGNNKLVFCKKTTVVEDFSNSKKDMQTQCSQPKNSNPSKAGLNKALSPLNEAISKGGDCVSTKSLNAKKHKKINKDSEKNMIENIENIYCTESDFSSPSQHKCNCRKSSSPLSSSKTNKNLKKQRSPVVRIPNAESIDRNIARLIDNNDKSQEETHSKRNCPKNLSPRWRKDSPVLCNTPEKRNRSHVRSERSSSNTSTDSISPHGERKTALDHWYPQSSPIKELYGLPSTQLSYNTREYLERYNLVRRESSSPCDDRESRRRQLR